MEGEGFEPSKAEPSDLQSDPFDRSGTPPNGTGDYVYFLSISQFTILFLSQYCQYVKNCLIKIPSFRILINPIIFNVKITCFSISTNAGIKRVSATQAEFLDRQTYKKYQLTPTQQYKVPNQEKPSPARSQNPVNLLLQLCSYPTREYRKKIL